MALAPKTLIRNGWTRGDAWRLLGAVVAALVATWPAWVSMAQTAIRYDHARPIVMVPPIVVWLVWVRRARFRFVRPGGYGIGWVVLAAGAQLFYMGYGLFGLRIAWHLGAVMMVSGAVIVCTGRSIVKQFLPAWAVLIFLVPTPLTLAGIASVPVQLFEARCIAALYGVLGIDVSVIVGPTVSQLVYQDTTLPLGSVCKGLPTALSLLLICYGFVFGSPMRPVVRATLLLISPVIALLCSALSLGGTLWLYDGRSALVTVDLIRVFSEWATLLFAFLLVAGALRVLAWASVPVHQYHLASESS